ALRQLHHHTECAAARDDGRLVHRVGGFDIERNDGVAAFVIGGQHLFLFGHDQRLALGAHHDLVLGVLELALRDHALVAPGRHQRPAPRRLPTASISSMKMLQGAFFLACSNMSRTRLAPTPTNISTKSEPEMVKNGTLASPATARAISVLPVPGGPTSSTPRGILPPSRWNFPGSRRNSTISCKSCLASSTPATSSKVTRPCASVRSFARDLPKPS